MSQTNVNNKKGRFAVLIPVGKDFITKAFDKKMALPVVNSHVYKGAL